MKPNYYFTSDGNIYAGQPWEDFALRDQHIVVPNANVAAYRTLQDKSIEQIKELAWVFPRTALRKTIRGDQTPSTQFVHEGYTWSGEYERKVMFIIGAGASAFCVTGDEQQAFLGDRLRPPLGNGLFAKSFKSYHETYEGVNRALQNLQADNCNVEELLETDWKDIQQYCNKELISRHINIQFYLQEILRDISVHVTSEYANCTLYGILADKLQRIHARNKRKHFAFVSFNQDTILETFLSKYFRLPFHSMVDYVDVNANPFCFFKPHGSWNWGWQFELQRPAMAKHIYDQGLDFFDLYFNLLGNETDMVDWQSFGMENSIHGKGKMSVNKKRIRQFSPYEIGTYYPAMLLPYRDKDEFTMPPVHQERLESYLFGVETLVIIGWKGNEMAFNKKLHDKTTPWLKRLIIVDPNAETVASNLKFLADRPGVESIFYKKGFEDFVFNGLEKETAV